MLSCATTRAVHPLTALPGKLQKPSFNHVQYRHAAGGVRNGPGLGGYCMDTAKAAIDAGVRLGWVQGLFMERLWLAIVGGDCWFSELVYMCWKAQPT